MRKWLYLESMWAVHNLVAHPVSQLLWWCSLCGVLHPVAALGDWLHDVTVPVHDPEEGRG